MAGSKRAGQLSRLEQGQKNGPYGCGVTADMVEDIDKFSGTGGLYVGQNPEMQVIQG